MPFKGQKGSGKVIKKDNRFGDVNGYDAARKEELLKEVAARLGGPK